MVVEEVETPWKQQQYADGVIVALLCDCSNKLLLFVRLPSLDFNLIHASPSRELLLVQVRWDLNPRPQLAFSKAAPYDFMTSASRADIEGEHKCSNPIRYTLVNASLYLATPQQMTLFVSDKNQ